MGQADQIAVDVIIPVYKPDEKFHHLMKKMGQQSIRPANIFLMWTQGKTEEDEELQERYKQVEGVTLVPILPEAFNHGGTRNQGVALAKSPLVLLMTQDAVPKNAFLIENLIAQFAEEEVAAAYAKQLATIEVGIIEHYTRQFNYPDQSQKKTKADLQRLGIKTYFCSDVCAMYRKSVYDQMGGFVTKTIFNEDMIMAAKMIEAGYTVVYAADAKVWHAHKYNGKQQFQRNFDLGVSHRQYKEIFSGISSEKEGKKLVLQTLVHLWRKKRIDAIISLIWQSGWKFLGYQFGKRYDKLPLWLIRMASSQKSYWNNGKG